MARIGLRALRRDLARHLDRVETDRSELVVTRPDHPDLVILPRAELEGLRETLHLLGSSANAVRLSEGIAELDAGRGTAHDLIEPRGRHDR